MFNLVPYHQLVSTDQACIFYPGAGLGLIRKTPWVPGIKIKPLKELVPVSHILPTGHSCYPLIYDHR